MQPEAASLRYSAPLSVAPGTSETPDMPVAGLKQVSDAVSQQVSQFATSGTRG